MTRPDQREREEKGGLSLQSLEQIVRERGAEHTAQQRGGAESREIVTESSKAERLWKVEQS